MASAVPRDLSGGPEHRRFLDDLERRLKSLEGATTAAPASASFVTVAAEAALSAARRLTAGTGISLTDGGAGSTLTITGAGEVGGCKLVASASTASGATVTVSSLAAADMFAVLFVGCSHNDGAGSRALQIELSSNNGSSFGPIITLSGFFANNVLVYGNIFIGRANQSGDKPVTTGTIGTAGGVDTGTTGTIDAMRFSWSVGSFDAGNIYVYALTTP